MACAVGRGHLLLPGAGPADVSPSAHALAAVGVVVGGVAADGADGVDAAGAGVVGGADVVNVEQQCVATCPSGVPSHACQEACVAVDDVGAQK